MGRDKRDIIAGLQKEILPLQGYKAPMAAGYLNVGLDVINDAFPGKSFPLGAVHEFLCAGTEGLTATSGFISTILSPLIGQGGIALWVARVRRVYPPALKPFGISPEKIIFIGGLKNDKEVLWVVEEALKCEGLSAVVGEVGMLNFTQSRRLQLAVEKTRVTGFILRHNINTPNITASIARWQVTPVSSVPPEGMPGVGFPRWEVKLLKARNGRPGVWLVEWPGGRLAQVNPAPSVIKLQKKKTG